ncbi:hypothetical protein JW921_06365 [Candidatus Fermentibacterales bacterium]|nr:hypothetical protein [Candidatus Fermentibacterales bacterium]
MNRESRDPDHLPEDGGVLLPDSPRRVPAPAPESTEPVRPDPPVREPEPPAQPPPVSPAAAREASPKRWEHGLSIVIVSEDLRDTVRCLQAIAALAGEALTPVEALVVLPQDAKPHQGAAEATYPFPCKWLKCDRKSMNACRNLAASRARFDTLAFLADDSIPQPGWLATATSALPEGPVVLTGPEPPMNPLGIAGCGYAAYRNAATSLLWPRDCGKRRKLDWYQVRLRNVLFQRSLLRKTGKLDEELPEEVEGPDLMLKARTAGAVFETDPRLRAYTDVYPREVRDLWEDAFTRASAGGEGLCTYTHILGRSRWVLGWALGPWVVANTALFVPWAFPVMLLGWIVLLLGQVPRLTGSAGRPGPVRALACLVIVQVALVAGMQAGLFRCLLGWLRGRRAFED